MNITVAGGGSWGTAMARLLYNKGHNLKFYIREEETIDNITNYRENKEFLPGAIFNGDVYLTSDIYDTLDDCEVFVLGVPTSACREVLTKIKDKIDKDTIIVNLSKGLEQKTHMRISQISKEILPDNPFVALSGPSHAEEVGKDIPTTVVVSSEDNDRAKIIQEEFTTPVFRIYTSSDLIGVEMGGALKNIIALAAGINDGLGFGDNTKAALMTRGIYEMSKLGMSLGADPHTFNGLSGIGDLIVTCTSMHSRNRRAGILIGKGNSMEEASKTVGQVVEGIKTVVAAYELAKEKGIEMPITNMMYKVLYEDYDPMKAVEELMTRKSKDEIEQIFYE